VKAWSACAAVHAAGGEARHYEAVVAAAVGRRRLVLIETSSEFRDAWLRFLAPRPVHLISTHGDAPHPIIPSTEKVH
jgi:hypothetical protein